MLLPKFLSRKISPEKSLDFLSQKSVLRPALLSSLKIATRQKVGESTETGQLETISYNKCLFFSEILLHEPFHNWGGYRGPAAEVVVLGKFYLFVPNRFVETTEYHFGRFGFGKSSGQWEASLHKEMSDSSDDDISGFISPSSIRPSMRRDVVRAFARSCREVEIVVIFRRKLASWAVVVGRLTRLRPTHVCIQVSVGEMWVSGCSECLESVSMLYVYIRV